MRIGNLEAITQLSKFKFLYYKYFGVPHYGTQVRFSKVRSLLNPSRKTKILDIGCGNGSYLNYASYMFGCSGVGVDRLEDVIAIACRVNDYYSLRNQFIISDINDYPFNVTEQKFDCILCVDVLEHIENPRDVLRKCISSLTPRGKLILSVPIAPVRNWLFKIKNHHFDYGPDKHVVDGYTEGELMQFISGNNGKVIKRIETFRIFGQMFWEISEKLKKIKSVYYPIVPLFYLLSGIDDLLSPSGTNSGLILVVERNA